jgi:hypothetical protein
MNGRVYSSKELSLDVRHDEGAVTVVWTGRSMAREPVTFIGPILAEAYRVGAEAGAPLVLDFRALEYMNSSTITPVIRILREASKGTGRVLVLYQRAAKWQELSFSALTIFETKDQRVEIRGV